VVNGSNNFVFCPQQQSPQCSDQFTFEPIILSNRLMGYNWQQSDWTNFRYDLAEVQDLLFAFAEETGMVTGILKGLPADTQMEAIIDIVVTKAIKTSAMLSYSLQIDNIHRE